MPTGCIVQWIREDGVGTIWPDNHRSDDVKISQAMLLRVDFLFLGDEVEYELMYDQTTDTNVCSYVALIDYDLVAARQNPRPPNSCHIWHRLPYG